VDQGTPDAASTDAPRPDGGPLDAPGLDLVESGDDAGPPEDVRITLRDPEFVYFNYVPGDDPLVTPYFDLRVERRADGRIYLTDRAAPRYSAHYAVNGAVRRGDARGLIEGPIDPNRWLHIVKFVADVPNINRDGWRTSSQYTGGVDTRFGASYQALVYVRDGSPAPALPHTEPLWGPPPVRSGLMFGAAPFSLPGHPYGSESRFRDEPVANLARVGWDTSAERYQLLYAGDVVALMGALGLSAPNGVTSLDAAGLERAANWLAARVPSRIFAVDFEPDNPARDRWMWDYDDPRFTAAMRALSDALWRRHGRLFYSWIAGSDTAFRHRGTARSLNGFTTHSWENGGADAWLAIHRDPSGLSEVVRSSDHVVQIGFGYTSTVINGPLPEAGPETWRAPTTWYLRALDVMNLYNLVSPAARQVAFLWPFEDLPNDSKRSPVTRFPLPGHAGLIRQVDNRVTYPPNLVRDGLVTMLANPRVVYTNYWIFGESYDPMLSLRYSRVNGELRCLSASAGGFFVYEYTGTDSPPCPTTDANYMGQDIPLVAAMIQAHELFARHLAPVLNGTQVREELTEAPRYQRREGAEQTAVWGADTGEFVRSWQHAQPWVQVWRNPASGQRIVLFQDPFAEPFEPVQFRVVVGGVAHTGRANGNELTWLRL
jgi:hypothetical protein